MSPTTARAFGWVEQGLVPDGMVRPGIRRLLKERLAELRVDDAEAADEMTQAFIDGMRRAPIALAPEKANEQHDEVPAEFFAGMLGPHRKYSGRHWGPGVQTLAQAEAHALRITCERADLGDGREVLELGCGWPTTTAAAASPRCPTRTRSAATSMAHWLKADGRFFLRVFAHRGAPHAFDERDATDWMSRHFFSGGMMPGDDLALNFMSVAELFGHDGGQRWWVSHCQFSRRA